MRSLPLAKSAILAGLGTLCLASSACQPTSVLPDDADEALHAIMAADDQRGTESAMATLRAGMASSAPEARAVAARALGRLERPNLIPELVTFAQAERQSYVRVFALHAIAQAAFNDGSDAAFEALLPFLDAGFDASTRSVAAIGIGRLRYDAPDQVRAAEANLLALLEPGADPALAEGVARGLDALYRNHRDFEPDSSAPSLLAAVALSEPAAESVGPVAASTALATIGAVTGDVAQQLLSSSDAEVRRVAVTGLLADDPETMERLRGALSDPVGRVRLQALRSARNLADFGCPAATAALEDSWLPVRLTALDVLSGCPEEEVRLAAIAGGAWSESGWQPAAHALVSLARVAAERAGPMVATALDADPWQARMHAANAASVVGRTDLLEVAAADEHPNVRHAGLRGLAAAGGSIAPFVAALSDADYQVVLLAARQLAESEDDYLESVLDALDRISAEERETSRDPRQALLRAAGRMGDASAAGRLEPYLRDFDPAVAAQAAEILEEWTGEPAAASPQPPPPEPFPTIQELRRIGNTVAVLHMDNGREIRLRFWPSNAPTHSARFFRLAADGYFDGLTFHRVVFNFVLQGGSPGANEYMGAGPYTRDEIYGRPHRRGTVGTSTRGRDTGDGQIFINLVDNLRLDFNYTVFADVTGDVDAIDTILEGAVIDSVSLELVDAAPRH